MSVLPKILGVHTVTKSRLFNIEGVDLLFSNGVKTTYERIAGGNGAVMVIPYDEKRQAFVFSREYCVGTEKYELGFVKGKIDPGEDVLHAAARELGEEIGLGAEKVVLLKSLNFAPGFMGLKLHLVLATGLSEHKLDSGDEPEPIIREYVPLTEIDNLIYDNNSELCEARCITGIILAARKLHLQI
ncbi:MAG: ADP compounds hydrolase NudE [Ruminobacter sp.]|jgi:ADP-ribose diphosphatase|nr:ADP compounds hydrolase NudE [Ruminobacter sp.]MBR1924930.1 ADP compounds hydrolase NudE [Ruminobacter sp.]